MTTYTVRRYRYCKAKPFAVDCPGNNGLKCRAGRLAEAAGGRYVGRARGYLMSAAQLARFQAWEADPTKDATYAGKLEDRV